jgi:hypothetical protein
MKKFQPLLLTRIQTTKPPCINGKLYWTMAIPNMIVSKILKKTLFLHCSHQLILVLHYLQPLFPRLFLQLMFTQAPKRIIQSLLTSQPILKLPLKPRFLLLLYPPQPALLILPQQTLNHHADLVVSLVSLNAIGMACFARQNITLQANQVSPHGQLASCFWRTSQ